MTGSSGQAGAVDEESFMQAFEEVPKKVTIFNGRTVGDELNKIKDTLAKTSNDWKVRIEALQMMRALLMAGADQYDETVQCVTDRWMQGQTDLKVELMMHKCITLQVTLPMYFFRYGCVYCFNAKFIVVSSVI